MQFDGEPEALHPRYVLSPLQGFLRAELPDKSLNKLRGFLTSCFNRLRSFETTLRNDGSWGWVVEFQVFALVMTKYWRSNSSQSMHTDIARRAKDHSEGAKRSGAPRFFTVLPKK